MLKMTGNSDDYVIVEGIESGQVDCYDREVRFEVGTVGDGGVTVIFRPPMDPPKGSKLSPDWSVRFEEFPDHDPEPREVK